MPTRSIQLSEMDDQFVARQLNTGRYSSACEVLTTGLHLLQQQSQTDEERLLSLREMVAAGFNQLDQNVVLTVADKADLREVVARIGRTAAEQAGSH